MINNNIVKNYIFTFYNSTVWVVSKQTYDSFNLDTIENVNELQFPFNLPKYKYIEFDGKYIEQCIRVESYNPVIFKQVREYPNAKIVCEHFLPIYFIKVCIQLDKPLKHSQENYVYMIIRSSQYGIRAKDNKDS